MPHQDPILRGAGISPAHPHEERCSTILKSGPRWHECGPVKLYRMRGIVKIVKKSVNSNLERMQEVCGFFLRTLAVRRGRRRTASFVPTGVPRVAGCRFECPPDNF